MYFLLCRCDINSVNQHWRKELRLRRPQVRYCIQSWSLNRSVLLTKRNQLRRKKKPIKFVGTVTIIACNNNYFRKKALEFRVIYLLNTRNNGDYLARSTFAPQIIKYNKKEKKQILFVTQSTHDCCYNVTILAAMAERRKWKQVKIPIVISKFSYSDYRLLQISANFIFPTKVIFRITNLSRRSFYY